MLRCRSEATQALQYLDLSDNVGLFNCHVQLLKVAAEAVSVLVNDSISKLTLSDFGSGLTISETNLLHPKTHSIIYQLSAFNSHHLLHYIPFPHSSPSLITVPNSLSHRAVRNISLPS